MARVLRPIAVLGLLLSAATPAPVRAETLGCIAIDALPTAIQAAGHYCLASDFVQDFADNTPLLISHADVVLDCNGHRIRHTAPANISAHGIGTNNNLANIEIRNCVIDGFFTGINVSRDDVAIGFARIENNTILNARVYGISVSGANVIVAGNRIDHTLGNSAANGPSGIYVGTGRGVVLRGNQITDIRPQTSASSGIAIGINLQDVRDSVIEDNVILGLSAYTGYGVYGILAGSSSGLAVNRNVIASPPVPGTPPNDGGHYYAILLQGTAEGVATNVCRDNITGHFNTDIAGCTKALNDEF
jgi:hypothetical protein